MLNKSKDGSNKAYYHGTDRVFDDIKNDVFWVSETPNLANQYADLRQEISGGEALTKKVWIGTKMTFDGDRLDRTLTIGAFLMEMAKQYKEITGNRPDDDIMRQANSTLKEARLIEESGPHYSPQDFWFQTHYKFGSEGSKVLMSLYQKLGFDSISFTEENEKTIGVLSNGLVVNAVNQKLINSSPLFSKNKDSKENFINRVKENNSELVI